MAHDPQQRALPAFARPGELDTLDITRMPGDEQLLVTSLQGVVNRACPRLYLLVPSEEGKETWLRDLAVPVHPRADLWEVFARYHSEARGLIIYDPAVPDSINAALTLAGLEAGVVASPRLAETLATAPYELAILADLRGRFGSRLDVYGWEYAALWPRLTHGMLVGISPTRGAPPSPYGGFLQDYAVANRAMVFWLDPNEPSERALFERILSDVPANTPYLGWFPHDVAGEFSGTQLTSAHGVYVLAADYFSNMTVFSGIPFAPATPSAASFTGQAMSQGRPRLENKIYVTFTVSEGDNLQYLQHRMRRLWDDGGRGRVPLNWTVDPLLADAAPTMLAYYQRTHSPNDLLIAGPSGAGYIYPNVWPDEHIHAFTRQSSEYMRRLGMDVVWVLNRMDGQSVALTPAKADAYLEDIAPLGILLNYEQSGETTIVRERLPQAVTWGVGNASEALLALAVTALAWDGTHPVFLSLGVLAWTMSPSDVAAVAEALGPQPQYAVVRGDVFFRLVREAYGLPLTGRPVR